MKKIESIIKNFLLRALLFFNSGSSGNGIPEFNERSKILFIRLNKIGDALVTTPLLKIVKEKTGAQIFVLADSKNHFIFRKNPFVDEVFVFNKKLRELILLRKKITNEKFDVVVDLHDDVSTTVSFMIASLKINYKFGLEKENEVIFTHTVKRPDPETNHIIDRMNSLAKLFDIDITDQDINIQYKVDDTSLQHVKNYLNKIFPENKFLVGINISAGSYSRFWGKQRFRDLINYFQNYNINLVLLCSTRDLDKAQDISHNKIKIYYSPDFNEFSAMISKLDFLFTPDTSVVHIASAFQIPVFGIYVKYNTNDMIWSPYKSKFGCVITEEPNFDKLEFEETINKLKPFFEEIYEERNS